MKENKQYFDALTILDSIHCIADYILPNTRSITKKASIALHPVCSVYKMGLTAKFVEIAR